jgi:hypothetical protein
MKLSTDEVLKSDCFLRTKRATLFTILEQDELCISSELDLFSACLRWAKNRIQETGSGLSIVKMLGLTLPLIRFRTMTSEEFSSTVVPSNVLTADEGLRILCCIVNKTGDVPAGFCNNENSRVPYGPRETLEKEDTLQNNVSYISQTKEYVSRVQCCCL